MLFYCMVPSTNKGSKFSKGRNGAWLSLTEATNLGFYFTFKKLHEDSRILF